jgi:RNA polymerase sigma-70 factor (ECF subfamily)
MTEEAEDGHQHLEPEPVVMTRDDDIMLIEACLRGDRHAFDKLVDRYEGPLYSAAYRITGSVDDAMDATQNAFVNAYEKLDTFDPSYRFFSWIYRIAVNQSLNLVGRRKHQTELEDDSAVATRGPAEVFDTVEIRGQLKRALLELEPHYRTAIVLKHLEGFSYREISELLDIPEKTVKSRLFTARQRLRAILTERGFAP